MTIVPGFTAVHQALAGLATVHVDAFEANETLAYLQTFDHAFYALPPFVANGKAGVTIVNARRVAEILERDRQQRWAEYFARYGC